MAVGTEEFTLFDLLVKFFGLASKFRDIFKFSTWIGVMTIKL